MSTSPYQPDIRRALKNRLLSLSPRAFELFAGDILVYLGLQDIRVTRYTNDGGIDADCSLQGSTELIRVPTGVQVKRQQANIRRPDVQRFLGALIDQGSYSHGIFMTTSDYAAAARTVGSGSMRIDTINGDDIVTVMQQHELGISHSKLDDDFFLSYEQPQAGIAEIPTAYSANNTLVPTEADLISLRALSYALHVDPSTIRRRVDRGELQPDELRGTSGMFFQRQRIAAIRDLIGLSESPTSMAEWRQAFLDFAHSRTLSRSYKPVLLKALIKVVNEFGIAHIDDVVAEFRTFYLEREIQGLIVEQRSILTQNVAQIQPKDLRRLIETNPLDRFIIQGFLTYDAASGIITFQPELWQGLRFYELIHILNTADEQLNYYYGRL